MRFDTNDNLLEERVLFKKYSELFYLCNFIAWGECL
ncbi:hypothetical protein ME1_00669 [Bartonella vinsonii subsp. arupensis OK-94-513]|uniref:Uncharacterized protein n=2 Tax=Bartonella vinsonii subsp. arupensis TaxID=110578 RepID=J1JUY8_BARVI|nr:hypothetical protein ME1_00669 [Bartonella vinsonii subsp. arupensis OK-94-513]EJF97458.1 hypothetical protein MEI_01152 [Bartonella vinsonii subsp. arupensis Pm136co]